MSFMLGRKGILALIHYRGILCEGTDIKGETDVSCYKIYKDGLAEGLFYFYTAKR